MTLPDLPAVHLQMLACLPVSPSITSELLFLLSSQGGYTMAYCQKEIKWWRAHTHKWSCILRALQSQLLIYSVQYCGLPRPPWLKCQGVELVVPLVFLGLPLAVKTRKEDRFSILRCLSCDQAGRRCRRAGAQNSRLFLLIN